MSILRAMIFMLGQGLSAVAVSLIALLCLWLPSVPRARVISIWARFNIWTLKTVCGVTFEVRGLDNLPQQPTVLLANHQSAWETLAFQLIFPPQSYIIKRELLWIPVFGWGLAANRPVAINRRRKMRALEQLLAQGAARLAEGRWVVIFPEGTRRPPGRPGKFHIGGAMLAVQSGAPVLPVAHNAGRYWPKRGLRKTPGVIQVRIGKPLPSDGQTPRELNAQAGAWIQQTLQTLR